MSKIKPNLPIKGATHAILVELVTHVGGFVSYADLQKAVTDDPTLPSNTPENIKSGLHLVRRILEMVAPGLKIISRDRQGYDVEGSTFEEEGTGQERSRL